MPFALFTTFLSTWLALKLAQAPSRTWLWPCKVRQLPSATGSFWSRVHGVGARRRTQRRPHVLTTADASESCCSPQTGRRVLFCPVFAGPGRHHPCGASPEHRVPPGASWRGAALAERSTCKPATKPKKGRSGQNWDKNKTEEKALVYLGREPRV